MFKKAIVAEELVKVARLLTGRKSSKLKKDIKLKSGDTYPRGTRVEIEWDDNKKAGFVQFEGQENPTEIPVTSLHKYLTGFMKPPGMKALERHLSEALGKTVTGQGGIESDGYDRYGFPAWPRALGIV